MFILGLGWLLLAFYSVLLLVSWAALRQPIANSVVRLHEKDIGRWAWETMCREPPLGRVRRKKRTPRFQQGFSYRMGGLACFLLFLLSAFPAVAISGYSLRLYPHCFRITNERLSIHCLNRNSPAWLSFARLTRGLLICFSGLPLKFASCCGDRLRVEVKATTAFDSSILITLGHVGMI